MIENYDVDYTFDHFDDNYLLEHLAPLLVVFRSDEKISYGIVWELQNDDRSLDAHDRLLLTPIKIFIHQK